MLGGIWRGVSALAGRRRPKATWLATRTPCREALEGSLPPLEVLGPEQVHKGLWHFAPLHPVFCHGLSGFSAAALFSHLPFSLWTLGTTLTPVLSAARGRPLQLCPPLASSLLGLGPRMGLGVPQLPPQGPQCLLPSLFLEPWGSSWASPRLGSLIRPRPVGWSLCKGCPRRLHRWQGGHCLGPSSPSPAGCDP